MSNTTINVSDLVDRQPLRPFTTMIFVLCLGVLLAEGYDLGVVGIAAPGIVDSFGIGRAAMAPVFSSALVGMLFGALLAGVLGDQFGRKTGLIVASVIICIGSFACAFADNMPTLIALRFLVGLGMGGTLPNVTALMAEYMPKRVRSAFTTFSFMGLTMGGIVPPLIAGHLGHDSWRELFIVGGCLPLVMIPLLIWLLPESAKFMIVRGRPSARLRTILQRLDPGIEIPHDAVFTLSESRAGNLALSDFFAGRLRVITSALWICFASIMLVQFLIASWLAIVLGDLGFSPAEAGSALSLYYIGGVGGGIVIGLLLDRLGPFTLVANALAGIIVAAVLGTVATGYLPTIALVFLVGFSVLGTQVGMSTIAGLIYPTAFRSKGAGFAHSVGRLGAISGPLIAGWFIAAGVQPANMFLVPILPLLLAAIGFYIIMSKWIGGPFGRGLATVEPIDVGRQKATVAADLAPSYQAGDELGGQQASGVH